MTEAWLVGRLRALWKIRNSAIKVDSERLALYADRLGRYGFPEGALAAALDQLEREDGDFFPSLGHIMAAIRDNLQRAGFLEAPDAAWARACREAGRYVPVVRPAPAYSSPAIAACVARLGGPTAFLADDDTARDILRREFLACYAQECMADDHLAFVARAGTYAVTVVPALEIAPGSAEQFAAERHARYWLATGETTPPGKGTLLIPATKDDGGAGRLAAKGDQS
jgi:hypothetical protein